MQSISTGYSMEIILNVLIVIILLISLRKLMQMNQSIKMLEIEAEFYKRKFLLSLEEFGNDLDKIQDHHSGTYRSLQDILNRLDAVNPIKPIKPNNWESIKEAFKGPTSNERN
jgi:hypothetical protein